MSKTLFLIHGRSFKPDRKDLRKLWFRALKHGLQRDHKFGGQFDDLTKVFVYYGDLSNKFLAHRRQGYNKAQDLKERKSTLRALKEYANRDEFNRCNYHKNSSVTRGFGEFAVDIFATPAHLLGVADELVSLRAPDIAHYWNTESDYGSFVRSRLGDRSQKRSNVETTSC